MAETLTKICTGCLAEKSVDDFWKATSTKDGYQYRCKACLRQFRIDNLERHQKADRDKHRRRKYGISYEQFEEMKTRQNGTCAICHQPCISTKNHPDLVVDHDHVTNRVRGLLCRDCNFGIGKLGDDVDRLKAAISYLESGESNG